MAALARAVLLLISTTFAVDAARKPNERNCSLSKETSNLDRAEGFQNHFSTEANPDAGFKVASANALSDKSLVQGTFTSGNEETDPNIHDISDATYNSATLYDEVKLVLMKHGVQTDNRNLISDLVALASKDKPMTKHAPHAALQIEEKDSQLVSPSVKEEVDSQLVSPSVKEENEEEDSQLVSPSVKGDPAVNVFLDGDTQLLNLRNVVVALWKHIPIGFRVEGGIREIRKFLTMRGVWHLRAHCHEDYADQPVYLVVTRSESTGLDKWKEQVAGFFGSSGVAAGATTLGAALGVGSETFKTIAQAVQMVSTNPANDIDDWAAYALDKWSESGSEKIKRLRMWWDDLKGTKYIAFLTFSDPVLKGKTGTYARFQCTKTDSDEFVVMSEPCQSEDVTSTIISAPHLALMISMMAGY